MIDCFELVLYETLLGYARVLYRRSNKISKSRAAMTSENPSLSWNHRLRNREGELSISRDSFVTLATTGLATARNSLDSTR